MTETGESRTAPLVAPTMLYLALIALVSRDVAVGLEPWGRGIPRRTSWLWLRNQPRRWPRRLVFWLGALFFYASVLLIPVLAFDTFNAIRSGEGASALRVVLPLVGLGVAGRWSARRVQVKG